MAFKIRIYLWSTDVKSLQQVVEQIREIAKKTGAPIRGPIPLPTKRLEVPIFRLPHGEGSKYWEHWELKIHKRIIDLTADERVLRRLMRIQIPRDVRIEIKQMRG
ncbi:MAG: 30S ribosomal protein S10 [Desulfurococcales archaeon]|nr:30S ribosomal protein S10 [Desulfurococcales archaeon]MCE4623048.1 30S ribosomal protein S10 [Desulfurococcales archaeon]MCE4626532.1 30S ribosomal protein S10 [Desulfurococcales archaeon]MCE4629827.1 30S ribosomal protein S10 [Desulfurococcales archaeon]NOZ30858.1 30S ribosomal protein S10 [Thermoproteota archaeon]